MNHYNEEPINDKPINHPMIATQERTCDALPEAYQGILVDGRHFVFRYRFGIARLSIGPSEDEARWAGSPLRRNYPQPTNTKYAVLPLGGDLQGHFDSCEQRDWVFSQLWDYLGTVEEYRPYGRDPRSNYVTSEDIKILEEGFNDEPTT